MNSTTTDQRGFPALGIRDIGAFEAQPTEFCQDPLLQTDGFTTSVASATELNQAIVCANLNGDTNGGDTINLSDNITLDTAFENNSFGSTGIAAIDSPIILNGKDFSIASDGTCLIDGINGPTEYRLIRVGATGDFILNNITLSNGCADGAGIDSNGGGITVVCYLLIIAVLLIILLALVLGLEMIAP